MIELGKKQTLTVLKRTDFGVYLGTEDEKVLLPKKYTAENTKPGDLVTVFVYRDSMDRMIATTAEPLITLGEVKRLSVKQLTRIGAFLDWGLEKDLFLPFKEQTVPVAEGKSYPVALYLDKSNRLCATMKLYPYLKTTDRYQKGDQVRGTAYERIDRFGMFVAVDGLYQGLIPKKELYGNIGVGEEISATVVRVLADGKMELAVRKPSYLQLEEDADRIYEELVKRDGILPLGDKTAPEIIQKEFQMSKAAFKRACGHLLKNGKATVTDSKILIRR